MKEAIADLLGHDKFRIADDLQAVVEPAIADIQNWVTRLSRAFRVFPFEVLKEFDFVVVELEAARTPAGFIPTGPQLFFQSKDGKQKQIFQAFPPRHMPLYHYATAATLIDMYKEGSL